MGCSAVSGWMLGMSKVRVETNVIVETKHRLDEILAQELEEDRIQNRPERSMSAILEMILKMGCRSQGRISDAVREAHLEFQPRTIV